MQTDGKLTINNIEENYLYISHLDSDYQFWYLPASPDSINDSLESQFNQTNVLGRSAPIFTYSHSGGRQIQVTLKLHRDIMNDINMTNASVSKNIGENEDYVDQLVKAIQAIAVPKYNLSNKAVEPPLVAVRFGKQIFIKGIVNGAVGITYEKPILSNGLYAIVTVSFTVSEVDPYDATSVFTNGSFRGVLQTLKGSMGMGENWD